VFDKSLTVEICWMRGRRRGITTISPGNFQVKRILEQKLLPPFSP
jgi:hypothetical protein